MGIRSYITDIANSISARVNADVGEEEALVVATRPLKTFTAQREFFTNPTYGADMNQNIAVGGTPDVIYAENVEWTGAAVSGTWNFAYTSQTHAGTYAVDGSSTVNNSLAQFTRGSILDFSGYTAISGWIYITTWPTTGTKEIELYGWVDGTSTETGVRVNIGDYCDILTHNAWQQFLIPLADMELASAVIDAFRIRVVDQAQGAAPDFYLDDLQVEQTGALNPQTYTVRPDNGSWFHVDGTMIVVADAYTGIITGTTTTYPTFPGLSYNKILGVTALTNGIQYQRIRNGETIDSQNTHQISDWLSFPNARIQNAVSDGTNTLITIYVPFSHTEVLKAEDNDEMRIIIRDRLDYLLVLRMAASGKKEIRGG